MKRGLRFLTPRKMYIQLVVLTYFVVGANSAYAYVAPGTAGMAIQALLATLAAGAATIAVFWQQVRAKFDNLFGGKADASQVDPGE